MDIYEIRRARLKQLIQEDFEGVAAQFARRVQRQPDYINRLLSSNKDHRKRLGEDLAREFESAIGKPRGWLDRPDRVGQPKGEYVLLGVEEGEHSAEEDIVHVENHGWMGSCGGGEINWEERMRKPLAFQKEWLARKGLDQESALLIYADGQSMEDFIQDGDVVLFNTSKTKIESGKIYAIQHPEGIRIKRLRLDYNGELIISSDNPDKARFPDDRLNSDQARELEVLGQFVWRGGG